MPIYTLFGTFLAKSNRLIHCSDIGSDSKTKLRILILRRNDGEHGLYPHAVAWRMGECGTTALKHLTAKGKSEESAC